MSNHPPAFPLGHSIQILESVDSSNNYAMARAKAGLAGHGTAWLALEQTAGKGQRGRVWTSRAGENIMLSLVLETSPLPAGALFALNMAMTLGAYQWMEQYTGEETRIKWPNDLYWRDRKAGGILIENCWTGTVWQFAIVGMGINVNQVLFDPAAKNPVSIKQITGRTLDLKSCVAELCARLEERWQQLLSGDHSGLLEAFNKALYKRGDTVQLKQGTRLFFTRIKGVNALGELVTEDTVTETCFRSGEVEWML